VTRLLPVRRSAVRGGGAIAALAASAALAAAPPGSFQVPAAQIRISVHNRLLLNRAAVSGIARLDLLLLTSPGALDRLAAAVDRADGRAGPRDDRIGYLRAEVPIEKVLQVVSDPVVEAWQIATESRKAWYRDGPTLASAALYRGFETLAPPRPGAPAASAYPDLPADEAGASGYSADEDSGLKEWRQRHPTFDGRGVTIAMIESGLPDFTHPAIGLARTLAGRDVPKLAGIVNAIDRDRPDATRVALDQEIRVTRSWARAGARTYIFPAPGIYRFGLFQLPAGNNLVQQFGIAEQVETGELRVDANGDGDFRNDHPIADVNDRPDVRALSLLAPETPLPFVVARGALPRTVHVYAATGSHLTMTLSVAAGSRNPRNLAVGVAPNARVLIVHAETRLLDYVDAYLAAARRDDVDVINDSTGVTLLPETGDDFMGRFLSRIAGAYGKVVVHSANNTQLFLNSASTPGDVLSIGGTMGAATLAALYGGRLDQLVVHPTGAAGPGVDGSIRPDVIAPVHVISADLMSSNDGGGLPLRAPRWRLPAGYQISCCTSSSSPYAAGLAALLVSAAKQTRLPYSRASLSRAIRFGARFLPAASAHHQGNGVFDVNAAWRRMNREIDAPDIHATARIAHPLAEYAAAGVSGVGILEREGWRAGTSGRRMIHLRRRSGPPSATTYRVSFTGNDGTFSAPSSIALPLDTPVALPIDIAAKTPGAHSALLDLHDPATDAIVFRTQATIVAAREFDRTERSLTVSGSIETMRERTEYFRVPERVEAMTLHLRVARGRVKVSLLPPHGVYLSYYRHVHPAMSEQFGRGTYVLTMDRPQAGVWAASVINDAIRQSKDGFDETADYALEIRLEGTRIRERRLAERVIALDIENTLSAPREPTIAHAFGTLTSARAAFEETGLPNLFDLEVPDKAGTLIVQARGERDQPLDLHLYDCSTGECFSYAFTMPAQAAQSITVRRPAAGRWIAAINAAPAATAAGSFVVESIVTGAAGPRLRAHGRATKGARWTELIELPPFPPPVTGAKRVAVLELFDAAMERDEEAHPWEKRAGIERLANRPAAIGRVIYRID
jgi:hypothetical protein